MSIPYAGAGAPWTLAALAKSRQRWAIVPKIDGCYAQLVLDDLGRVEKVLSRNGKAFGANVHQLTGVLAGQPHSILVGELECMTENGINAAKSNPGGLPSCHLFDVLQVGRIPVADIAYRHRRDALYKMQAQVQALDTGRAYELDDNARAHHRVTGRFCKPLSRSWKRLPIVPQWPAAQAQNIWDDIVQTQRAEGIVAVNLDAPLRRGSKRKIKPHADLNAVVLSSDKKGAILHWLAADVVFTVGTGGKELMPGSIVEVRHEGYYADHTPRFARLVRERSSIEVSP